MIKQTNQNTEQKKKLPLSSDIVFKRVFSTEDKTATKGIEIHIIELPKLYRKIQMPIQNWNNGYG